jgi:hypothetical protein
MNIEESVPVFACTCINDLPEADKQKLSMAGLFQVNASGTDDITGLTAMELQCIRCKELYWITYFKEGGKSIVQEETQ